MRRGSRGYLSNRLLKLQVGFLLAEGPGYSRKMPLDIPQRLKVAPDLFVDALCGDLALTRTKDGILARGSLQVWHRRFCDRCVEEFTHEFAVPLAELFAYPANADISAFSVDSNGEIDLAPLLREEVIIEESYRAICRDDCRGLSAESGVNLNEESEPALIDSQDLGSFAGFDPRLSALQQLLDRESQGT